MADEQRPPDEDERAFVARKLGELYAELAKLIATFHVVTPTEMGGLARRNRWRLNIIIILLALLIVVLLLHAAFSAGWLGR